MPMPFRSTAARRRKVVSVRHGIRGTVFRFLVFPLRIISYRFLVGWGGETYQKRAMTVAVPTERY
jgi:hypothetical protein